MQDAASLIRLDYSTQITIFVPVMLYSFQELLLSIALTAYLAVSAVVGTVRWGHKCAPYAKHMDYYFPAWRTLVVSALFNLILLPVIFLPQEADAILQLRMMLILSSPFFCALLIFSYFGRVLKLTWWRKPIYVMSGSFLLMSVIALVLTLVPGTQIQGAFLRWFFVIGGSLALIYLAVFILALRMMVQAIRRFSEENYSNPDDFPKEYAESIVWIPILHLIMSWSATINGNPSGLSFGLVILSILGVIILLGALSPHRAVDVERLEQDLIANNTEKEKAAAAELLSPDRKEEILGLIRQAVEDRQAYLDSNLTLSKLSHDCGLNRTYISAVLNERLGGFFAYINRCRVTHAETYRVSHPGADVDEVALASGFNNRQSYYNARKRL